MDLLRKYINIIIEEIGRNYHTIDTSPYSYEDYPGISSEIYPVSDSGQWFAQVKVEFDDKLSTPLRTFASEEDARSFVRKHVEDAHRHRMSTNVNSNMGDDVHMNDLDLQYDID